MLKPTPEMLRALGLTEEELGDHALDTPDANIARGDAATAIAAGTALLQALLGQLESGDAKLRPASSVEVVEMLQACVPGASVNRFSEHPAAVVVHVPGARVVLTGTHLALSDDEFLLAEDGAACVDGPMGSVLTLCGDGGKTAVYELPPVRLARLADWTPSEQIVVEPPAPSKLTGGLAIEPWLVSAVHERLESDSPVDRVTAVGLMGRLWSPVSREDAAAARERSLAGAGPGQDGRAWWRSLPERDCEGIVQDALLRVDDLAESFEGLSESVADEPEEARPKLMHWLHDRDDLESIAFLTRGTPLGDVLAVALERLDEAVSVHHSMWSFVAGFEDERLRAVACADLDAWWGQLAEDA